MKKILIPVLIALIIIIGFVYFNKNTEKEVPENPDKVSSLGSNPSNTNYSVDGESFDLVDGFAEKETAPGSSTKSRVSVFGEPSFGDIDGDGDDDAVLLLMNNPGGSGTFYYATIAVNTDGVYKGTDSILLGDRISPQNYSIENGKALVNYLTRNFEEDFSVKPSVGKSLYMKVDPKTFQLIQIASDFEGEADLNVMKLDMQPWTWIKTTYSNDTELKPQKPDAFKLTFKKDGSVLIGTDCNSMTATYKVDKNKITFTSGVSTLMFCEGSQEQDFAKMLTEIDSFMFTSKGELVFNLKMDSGSATFR